MNQMHQQVTYKTVSDIAIKQWHEEKPTATSIFSASPGWIRHFNVRHGLSSQVVSRSSVRKHANISDHPEVVFQYKMRYEQFVNQYGLQHVHRINSMCV